jgi:alpha-L-rhamnosidase
MVNFRKAFHKKFNIEGHHAMEQDIAFPGSWEFFILSSGRCSMRSDKNRQGKAAAFFAFVIFILPLAGSGQSVSGPPVPLKLRCEYLTDPIGIDVRQPRFSWLWEQAERGEVQSAYQVLVASSAELLKQQKGDQWDSGKVESDNSTQVVYSGTPLGSGRTYYWKVRCWDKEGRVSPYSLPAQFEVGLLSRDEWKGQWIGGGNELRKEFRLPRGVVRGRVYVTALGYDELWINGKRIGNSVLDPAWTTYPKRVLYTTYDVTSTLEPGANAIAIMLGGGWATQTVPTGIKPYYDSPALLLQMEVELKGGGHFSLASDGSWKVTQGPILGDSVYDGEVYDARRETPGWDRSGFDDSAWKNAQVVAGSQGILSAQMMPPIRVVDELVPHGMTNPKPGVYVYDLGQNISGWARIDLKGARGTRVQMRYAELVYADGMINRANFRNAKSRDVYILRGGGREVYQPRFTYHGFRYVEVTGYPGTPGLDSLRGEVVHTAVGAVGSFVASKQILNQIQHLIHWSQLTNLHSIPTDCDQRDERQGWLGDAQLTAEEAMMNFDMAAFYTNFIRDIRDAQNAEGAIPETVPYKYGGLPGDLGWESAYPLLCWYMWEQYGDRRILEENYEGLKKYVEFLRRIAVNNVVRYHIGSDWALVYTPWDYVADAWYYYDVQLFSKIAQVVGNSTDASAYGQLAVQIKEALNRAYFNAETGQYANGTQMANAMALFLDLPPQGQRDRVAENLINSIIYYNNTHIATGFLGAKFVMAALTLIGRADVGYDLATQTTFPSWGYMVSEGATTLWELWLDRTGPSMNSHNHAMLGSIGAWFYQTLAGINLGPGGAGYRHIRIEPHPEEDLNWASGTFETIRGRVSSTWSHSAGVIRLEVIIPAGADATVLVPKEVQMTAMEVREGDHVVWENGHYVAGDPGVNAASQTGKGIDISVASGSYSFILTGD